MIARRARPTLAAVVCAWVLLGQLGCKGRRKSEPPGPKINRVTVEGNEALDDATVASHMNMRPSKFLGDKNYYVPGLEELDDERIEDLYAAHGHYEAKVHDIDVTITRRNKKMKRRRARVHVKLSEGRPTPITAIEWTWEPAIEHGKPLDKATVEQAAGIEVGDTFSIPAFEASQASVLEAVREQGYAFAEVERSAEVDRRRRVAKIFYTVRPGERVEIDQIAIEGLERVRERLVRRELKTALGRQYSPTLMRQAESSVYGMGVFSTVAALPGKKVGPGRIVLDIKVREREMQQIGFGVLLELDPIRWSQRAGMRYEHANLFRNVTKFEAKLLAGYAQLPHPFQVQTHGPRADLELRLSKRGLLERKLVWTEEPSVGVDILQGYQFWYFQNRAGVSRFLGKIASLGLSYNNRYVDFFNITGDLFERLREQGLPVPDPYINSYLEVQAELFKVDNLLLPTQGVRLIVLYQFAQKYLGSDFNYHLVQPELRGYVQPHDRLQFAARARVGFIFPFGGTASAPIDERFYLGGVTDVRGWGLRRLSPRVEVCDVRIDGCETIPIGGSTEVLGNLEMRVRVWKQLWLATFGDVGDVRAGIADINPREWFYSTGGGIRYGTPVGPLRIDVGVVLNPQSRFEEPRRWAFHFTIGEAF